MSKESPTLLFHYTTGNIFKRILKEGALLPDRTEPDNENEIPSVTFSSNPVWEKTRYRVGKMPDGQLVLMSQKMLQKYDGGCIRIVVPAREAPMTWYDMKDQLGMSSEAIKGIYDFAVEVGARTSEWFATTEKVSEDAWITVEKLDENENWVELPEDELPDVNNELISDSPVVEIFPQEIVPPAPIPE